MLSRKWDKNKIYDRMHGYGWVSEIEIKTWFQAEEDEGTFVFYETPVGKFKLFTPIAPDLFETLEEMRNYGMIEIEMDISPVPYGVLDVGSKIYKHKLMVYNQQKKKWEPVSAYPEFIFRCKDIGRDIDISSKVDEIIDEITGVKSRSYKFYLKNENK